jgi:hypothetical protein
MDNAQQTIGKMCINQCHKASEKRGLLTDEHPWNTIHQEVPLIRKKECILPIPTEPEVHEGRVHLLSTVCTNRCPNITYEFVQLQVKQDSN